MIDATSDDRIKPLSQRFLSKYTYRQVKREREREREKRGRKRKKEGKKKYKQLDETEGSVVDRALGVSLKCNEVGLLISCSGEVGEKKRVNFESGSRRAKKFVSADTRPVPFVILKSSRWFRHGIIISSRHLAIIQFPSVLLKFARYQAIASSKRSCCQRDHVSSNLSF